MSKERNKLIRDILWEMWWFGDFGNRKDYIGKLIEDLTDSIDGENNKTDIIESINWNYKIDNIIPEKDVDWNKVIIVEVETSGFRYERCKYRAGFYMVGFCRFGYYLEKHGTFSIATDQVAFIKNVIRWVYECDLTEEQKQAIGFKK